MAEYVYADLGVPGVLRAMRGVVEEFAGDLESWEPLTPQEAFSRVAMIPYVMDVAAFPVIGGDGEAVHEEVFGRPRRLLELPALDCKKKSILLASWARVKGFPWRFVAVDYDGGGYSHVYASVYIGGRWLEMDATIRGLSTIGSPDGAVKRRFENG